MSDFIKCPRCNWKTCERLRTHHYCANCNYNNVEAKEHRPSKRILALIAKREQNRKQKAKEVQDG